MIDNVKFYTGAFPTSFGGKTSSVIDVSTRYADFDSTLGSIEFGVTSGKGHLELPIVKKKLSLLMAGRRSFFDALALLNQADNKEYFNFYDLNSILTYKPDSINTIKLSTYFEGDQLHYVSKGTNREKDALEKEQRAISLDWKRQWSFHIKSQLTTTYNHYSNKLKEERKRFQDSDGSYSNYFRSRVSTLGTKFTVDYDNSKDLNAFLGAEYLLHYTDPSEFYGDNKGLPFRERSLDKSKVEELSAFTQLAYKFKNTTLTLGARYTTFKNGYYSVGLLEPRVSLYQQLGGDISIKSAYSRMTQPIQRLLNAGLGMPMEIIFPSDELAQPQASDIVTLGFAKDFQMDGNNHVSISLEGYYKKMNNMISFLDGYDTRSVIYHAVGGVYRVASVYDMIATDGKGRSRGIDFRVDGSFSNINGWLGYSISHVENKFDVINKGNWFDGLQDRRHVFNAAIITKINDKWSFSASWMFSSGQPVNIPTSYFALAKPYPDNSLSPSKDYVFSYGKRNGSRMIPFHKLDIGVTKQVIFLNRPSELNFGIYNAYNRKNPSFYFLDIDRAKNAPQLRSLSLFQAMPSISIKVNFN